MNKHLEPVPDHQLATILRKMEKLKIHELIDWDNVTDFKPLHEKIICWAEFKRLETLEKLESCRG